MVPGRPDGVLSYVEHVVDLTLYASEDGDVALNVKGEDVSVWYCVGNLHFPLNYLEDTLRHSIGTLAANGWDVESWMYDCALAELRRLLRR